MFTLPVVDNLIARFTPHAITLRDECRSWATAITDRLDSIVAAVESDTTIDTRPRIRGVAGGILPGQAVLLAEVPVPQEWELEYVTVQHSAGIGDIVLQDGGGGILWTQSAAALTTGNYGGNGLRIGGGTQVFLVAVSGAKVYLQFRYERPRPARPNVSAGIRNLEPDRQDAVEEVHTEARHAGSWHPGIPVFGPTAPRVNGR